jgi:SAM-dependent methyltransferase
MDRLAPAPGETLLDVGCGCGDTSLELARRVGAEGEVLGLDISAPMLDVARRRAKEDGARGLEFREADAQTAALPGGRDAVFSRFGVMFFADPVAAFRNLRRALRPGGRLVFVCWRPLAENLWMRLPAETAAGLVPPAPPPEPGAPGPFAFADPDRVRRILAEAGFAGIEITPHDEAIGGLDLEGTVEMSFRVGPLGAILRERPDLAPVLRDRVRVAEPLRTSYRHCLRCTRRRQHRRPTCAGCAATDARRRRSLARAWYAARQRQGSHDAGTGREVLPFVRCVSPQCVCCRREHASVRAG